MTADSEPRPPFSEGYPFWILAATVLVTTPLLWHSARTTPWALSPLLPLSGALVAAAGVQRSRSIVLCAAAGALLGAGMYTTDAAMVMMPVYAALAVAVFGFTRVGTLPALAAFAIAFVIASAPVIAGFIAEPDRFRELVLAHRLYDAGRFNLLQGIREMTSWVGLTARTEVYYDHFNPAFLFLGNQVLLLPMVLMVPIGIVYAAGRHATPFARLMLAGFLAAPFASALTAEPPRPERLIFLTPFAAALGAYGLLRLVAWMGASSGAGLPIPGRPSRQ